jgi:hypothetical protein
VNSIMNSLQSPLFSYLLVGIIEKLLGARLRIVGLKVRGNTWAKGVGMGVLLLVGLSENETLTGFRHVHFGLGLDLFQLDYSLW